MAERQLMISHPIGPTGRFRLSSASGTVRIDGTDGDVVDVLARYRAPTGVDPASNAEQDGVVEVTRGSGELHIAVHDAGGSGVLAGLSRLVGAYRPDVDFEVRVPRGASVRFDGVSSDGRIRGLRGDQDLHTVSGDVELLEASGRVQVTTVSGDVSLRGDVVSVTASTTSGDIAVDAELVEQLAARSVSGDVSVRAALSRDVAHTFESVSGDLQISTPSGLSVDVSGVSGSVRTDLPTRREQRDGRRVTIVGDGAVSLRVRTVSGSVLVSGPRAGVPSSAGRQALGAGFGAAPTVAAAAGPTTGGTTVQPLSAGPRSTTVAPAGDQLGILRLLESGQIDVEEAARRLEALS